MSTTIIRPKDHEAWLEARKSGIGSSEVASILGLNPWETPYQLWRIKTGLDGPKEENFAMRAGHYLEDAVSRFWHDETGRDIIKSSAGDWLMRDDEKPFLQVSPDRTYWLPGEKHNNENKGILECKTTQMSIDAEDIPKHWFCQVQYQLGVAGYTHGSLAWLSAGREFGYRDLAFVPDFYEWVVEEVERFWKENIIGGREPEPTAVADILLKFRRHETGKTVEADEETYGAYKELKEVKERIAELEGRKTELEDRMKMRFEDAEAMSWEGRTIATFKAPKPGSKFDEKAFRKDNPDLAATYMKETQGARRFLLK